MNSCIVKEEGGKCCNLRNKKQPSKQVCLLKAHSNLQLSKVAVNLFYGNFDCNRLMIDDRNLFSAWSFCYFLHTNEMKTQKNVPAPAQSTFYTFERFLQIQLSSSLR
ncbi:hypothetical protein T08_5968 [Trichinella sp. T8]|nr:hypothetical protein T08_5968 [Trichinella sp. T8]